MRDFKCVLHKEERMGSPVTIAEIRNFKKCVENCALTGRILHVKLSCPRNAKHRIILENSS